MIALGAFAAFYCYHKWKLRSEKSKYNKILDTFALFTTSTIEVKCVDTNKAPLKGFHVNHMGGFVGQQRAMVAFNCGKTKAS